MTSRMVGRVEPWLLLLGVAFVAAFLNAEGQTRRPIPSEKPAQVVGTRDLAVELAPDGQITGILFKKAGIRKAVSGGTRLEGCAPAGNVVRRKGPGGGAEFETALADGAGHACRLIQRFIPTPTSVRWEVEIRGSGGPWSTAIETQLRWPEPGRAKFWCPWGDPRQGAHAKMEASAQAAAGIVPEAPVGDWSDPLVPMPFVDASLWIGAPAFTYDDPGLAFIPYQPDLLCIPLATVIDTEKDLGLSLALSPADPYLELTLATRETGEIIFGRSNHRIQDKTPLKFGADIVAHEGDWRGGLGWMVQRYPEYFDPAVAGVDELAGTGAYSTLEDAFDAAKMRKMAFRTNWKASYDFPYPGMFLPPIPTGEYWGRFGGGLTSIPWIREYCRRMRDQGFFVLNYFNVTEFGVRIVWPPLAPKAVDDADAWKDANEYLNRKLADAILFVPERTKFDKQRAYKQTKVNGPYYTWQGGIILDPGEPVYRDFLLDQARRHIAEFPGSSGICIDRMDWLRMYNERRDDGVSWFGGLPVRSLYNSWRDIMGRLGPLMHDAGKAVFLNNHTKRIDLSRYSDGYFDEFTNRGVPLNLTALLAIRRPAMGWTESAADVTPNPDAFFQRYLYLGVYPMAPFPMNDHSIESSAVADPMYIDYGPLLDAMRGKRWVLSPHCVQVEDRNAKVNAFQVPGGYAVPVVYGGNQKSVRLRLSNLEGLGPQSVCRAIHPGSRQDVPLAMQVEGGEIIIDVPLIRGCAMVCIDTGQAKR
jgi:hypothetical protein